jgi:hypothetical protein
MGPQIVRWPRQELSGVEGLCGGPPGSLVPVSSDGSIEVEAFEGQWGPQEISCEVLETGTVFGRSRDPVVSRETGVAAFPGIEKLEAIRSEEPFVGENREDFLAEEQLGGGGRRDGAAWGR